MRRIALTTIVCVASVAANAQDLEGLAMDGFGVAIKTSVAGEFKGCEFNRAIPLQDGLIFKCSSYSYHYAYSPTVLILKNVNDGRLKVMIDREEFDGTLYRR